LAGGSAAGDRQRKAHRRRTRSRLEREGQSIDALFACDEEARDGTRLPGCVKVYLPPPGGPLGLVFEIAKSKHGRLYLAHLAFGVRHLPAGARGETVYRLAHRRLNR
jgi:hypothetical protein